MVLGVLCGTEWLCILRLVSFEAFHLREFSCDLLFSFLPPEGHLSLELGLHLESRLILLHLLSNLLLHRLDLGYELSLLYGILEALGQIGTASEVRSG